MSSFLVLREGYNRNGWRDRQVCPDVGQGIMAPWARRLGCVLGCYAQETKKLEREEPGPGWRKRKKPCPGSKKHGGRALGRTDWKRALKKRAETEIGVEKKDDERWWI
ncbi:hypothetical protein TNCV_1911681 [Trichonephila clavipes]|nr:hypothetical protein TNCV_1911681 [Trichonephila clavipes]